MHSSHDHAHLRSEQQLQTQQSSLHQTSATKLAAVQTDILQQRKEYTKEMEKEISIATPTSGDLSRTGESAAKVRERIQKEYTGIFAWLQGWQNDVTEMQVNAVLLGENATLKAKKESLTDSTEAARKAATEQMKLFRDQYAQERAVAEQT